MSAAALVAQSLLTEVDQSLILDGRIGSYTKSVYTRAPDALKERIDATLRAAYKTSWAQLTMRYQPPPVGVVNVSTTVRDAIQKAADEFHLPTTLLLGFAKIESNFNPLAENGSSKGLFQIQKAAWTDASKIAKLRPFSKESWSDPLENARAAAAYQTVLIKQMRRLGYAGQLRPSYLYVAHQQGAGGFIELWKASNGEQGTTNYVTSIKMQNNPPQDGKGKTTNKKEFFDRWVAAVENRISALD